MKALNNELYYNGKLSSYNIPQWKYLLDSDFLISHKCCYHMKKSPAYKYERTTGRKPIIATLTEESRLRQQKWLQHGCNAFDSSRPISQPMSFWTEQDVLQYIYERKLSIASIYGEVVYDDGRYHTTGLDRTGCIFCGFGVQHDKTPNRFQQLKITHPKQYDYCINGGEYVNGNWQPNESGLGIGKVLDFIGVSYE